MSVEMISDKGLHGPQDAESICNCLLNALQPNPTAFQRECVKPDCTEVDRCVALFQINYSLGRI